MENMCALIMAGGKGTRFWPLSTAEKPKQFLNLISEYTMIQMTVNRLKPIIPIDRIFVCTAQQYLELIKNQLPELPEENIIIEPYGKNTAPCIALSAFQINKKISDATIIVLPSDHLIEDEENFRRVLLVGKEFIEKNQESIVTIGLNPCRPETGYGYIQYGEVEDIVNEKKVLKVNKFVEKPSLEKAKEFLKDGRYLWNGGMFIWKAANILNLTRKYMKNTYSVLSEISAACDEEYETKLFEKYNLVDELSVDYGIMEHAKEIYVIKAEFGWDDVGSWSSIERYSENNLKTSKLYEYKSEGNIVVTNKKVLLNNVENLIVVETDDYIMISSKENEQEIKSAKELFNI